MKPQWLVVLMFAWLGSTTVNAQPDRPVGRGELLYTTYCIACHTTQVHWRDKKVARDWDTLVVEVARWQKVDGLGWSNDQVVDVARYLNALHYHYQAPGK